LRAVHQNILSLINALNSGRTPALYPEDWPAMIAAMEKRAWLDIFPILLL